MYQTTVTQWDHDFCDTHRRWIEKSTKRNSSRKRALTRTLGEFLAPEECLVRVEVEEVDSLLGGPRSFSRTSS